jgi:DNA-binding winged helix-turn-helix (wHTH) protein
VARLSDSACDGGVRPFGILIDGRPLRLGARAFDVPLALIEESPAVISKGELLSRVRRTRPRQ